MSKSYDEGHYLARTLAVTLLDLEPAQRDEILKYLHDEIARLTRLASERSPEKADEDDDTPRWPFADNDEGRAGDSLKHHEA